MHVSRALRFSTIGIAALYVVPGVVGALVSVNLSTSVPSVGAPAAVCGLIGESRPRTCACNLYALLDVLTQVYALQMCMLHLCLYALTWAMHCCYRCFVRCWQLTVLLHMSGQVQRWRTRLWAARRTATMPARLPWWLLPSHSLWSPDCCPCPLTYSSSWVRLTSRLPRNGCKTICKFVRLSEQAGARVHFACPHVNPSDRRRKMSALRLLLQHGQGE